MTPKMNATMYTQKHALKNTAIINNVSMNCVMIFALFISTSLFDHRLQVIDISSPE